MIVRWPSWHIWIGHHPMCEYFKNAVRVCGSQDVRIAVVDFFVAVGAEVVHGSSGKGTCVCDLSASGFR